ncbi:hypothetical protein PR202_ga15951 [Eleusine coracana subsp. coracana]|uniref:Cyclic phosphodiesterase n=1 Tax=Eleusine coracana subsp. coracana TaxID=191504 RepID=A0AAV5CLJ1_ELECO|nr:hypothetical protein QOZ80_6BG0487310 [Eleusine coracana subsp. coracana]GJM98899.1 hypothetical protein PR202_ga15951 [Eleusine coracana subsp. coracana]
MEPLDQSPEEAYSVWALPPEPVRGRLRRLMAGLCAVHGGPVFEPHVTVVGAVRLRRSAAIEALRAASAGVRPYTVRVTGGSGFYNRGCLVLEPTPEVISASDHCCSHFGYQRSTSYKPHLSLTYGDRAEEREAALRKKVEELDEDIRGLQFEISELALYTTEPGDVESWQLVEAYQLTTAEE